MGHAQTIAYAPIFLISVSALKGPAGRSAIRMVQDAQMVRRATLTAVNALMSMPHAVMGDAASMKSITAPKTASQSPAHQE